MSRPWKYQGCIVLVSPTADIPTEYRMGKRCAAVVQEVLDEIPPWQEGDDPIETVTDFDVAMPHIVVPRDGGEVLWAKHKGHHARRVGLSPFVTVARSYTRAFTVEMTGSSEQPRLVRAYPGDYIPPLPWQNSARSADGGRDACLSFWRQYAYIYRPSLVVPGSVSETPPEWFTS